MALRSLNTKCTTHVKIFQYFIMTESTFFHIVSANNPSTILRGLTTWFPEKYTIKLLLGESIAYEGQVSVDVMSECCQTLGMTVEEYLEHCKIAFKNNSDSIYSFSIDDEHLNIRKRHGYDSVSPFYIMFSSTPLKTIDYSSAVLEILDSALRSNKNYCQTIDTLSQNAASLVSDYQKAVMRLEEIEKDKLQFESIIYHKFVNLLNSKKEFYSEQKACVAKDEAEELPRVSCTRNAIQEAIFDAETDSDEVDDPPSHCKSKEDNTSHYENELSIGAVPPTIPIKKSPDCPKFESKISSKVENVLNSLSFLDPSVSFLNK